MPITPLHFGVLAPVNHIFPGKVSLISFTLVNALIDAPHIKAALTGQSFPPHDGVHSFIGVLIVGMLVAMQGVQSAKWVIVAYFAALARLFLGEPVLGPDGNSVTGITSPHDIVHLPIRAECESLAKG
jgi:hypothetical protein